MAVSEDFSKAAKAALVDIMCSAVDDEVSRIFDAKGASFDFYIDGGADSLDILDIGFSIEKSLGIKLGLRSMVERKIPMTLENLYNSVQK